MVKMLGLGFDYGVLSLVLRGLNLSLRLLVSVCSSDVFVLVLFLCGMCVRVIVRLSVCCFVGD